MSTKINIIVSTNHVWATYSTTICFKMRFTDEDSKAKAIQDAYATAFSYALGFGAVLLSKHDFEKHLTDADIFELLQDKIG